MAQWDEEEGGFSEKKVFFFLFVLTWVQGVNVIF